MYSNFQNTEDFNFEFRGFNVPKVSGTLTSIAVIHAN
jgi:hypothetical protein